MNFFLLLLPLTALASAPSDLFISYCSFGDVPKCMKLINTVDRAAYEPAFLTACLNCQTLIIDVFHAQHKMPLISREVWKLGVQAAVTSNCYELALFLASQEDDGLYRVALQCASLGNLMMFKQLFTLPELKLYRNRPGLLHLAIQGNHTGVVDYLLETVEYEPLTFVKAFRAACRANAILIVEAFLRCTNSEYWVCDTRSVLLGLLSIGSVSLMQLAVNNESFVNAIEACDPNVISDVMKMFFFWTITADQASLSDSYELMKSSLDLHILSRHITSLVVFDLAMDWNRSWLLLAILYRCPNINLKAELTDEHYNRIIESRFLQHLVPFVLVNGADLRYLMMCIASHNYQAMQLRQREDFEVVYDHAKAVANLSMASKMDAAQHTYNISGMTFALQLIDNDDELDRLTKIRIANENGRHDIEKYLTGIHLVYALYISSDNPDFWLPSEIKLQIVKTYWHSN